MSFMIAAKRFVSFFLDSYLDISVGVVRIYLLFVLIVL